MTPLEKHIADAEGRACDYRDFDCFAWVARWAGFADRLPTYSGRFGALRAMRRHFGAYRIAQVADQFLPRIPVHEATRGDLLAIADAPLDAFGICIGRHGVYLAPNGQTAIVANKRASFAWRVDECPL